MASLVGASACCGAHRAPLDFPLSSHSCPSLRRHAFASFSFARRIVQRRAAECRALAGEGAGPGGAGAEAGAGAGQAGLVLGAGAASAWDCAGTGRAAVRRLQGQGQDAWLMWYEGWGPSAAGAGDAAALEPPWCVGLAQSANGLIWTRGAGPVETDSRGRGGAGVVLQPSSNWWSFDTRHVRVSDVILMASPRVRASEGLYWMFYEGASLEEIELPDSIPAPQQQALLDVLQLRGPLRRTRPGLAMSPDGRNWAAIEGEHHSGALLDVGAEGEWDSLLIGGPHVAYHRAGDLRMYYHALDPATGRFRIGLARSRDGLKWIKLGVAFLDDGDDSAGALGCMNAQVLRDPRRQGDRDEDAPGYVMLYERVSRQGQSSICLAESEDGLSGWRHQGVLLEPSSAPDAWDSASVGSPCLVDLGDGEFRLYYVGRSRDGVQGIGVAEAGGLSFQFTRHPSIMLASLDPCSTDPTPL